MAGVEAAAADTSTTCSNGSVTSQGYCSPVTTPTTSSTTTAATTTAATTTTGTTTTVAGGVVGTTNGTPPATPQTHQSGVAGAKKTLAAAPLRTSRQSGTLPFTGVQLSIFVLVGLALILGGFLLHTTGRRRRRPGS